MGISPPNHQKDAIPTTAGWRHPRTNELLVARKINQGDIDEYLGVVALESITMEFPMEEYVHGTLSDNAHEENEDWHQGCHSADPNDLENMSKTELEDLGREYGIELDRRERKSTLIEKLSAVID